jgi:hypothetical protein
VIIPRLELLREAFQERMLPRYDERLVIDYDNPAPPDKDLQLEYVKAAPWALSHGQWLERMGEQELPEEQAEVHAVPQGMRFVADLTELEDEPEPESAPVPPGPTDAELDEIEAEQTVEAALQRAPVQKGPDPLRELQRLIDGLEVEFAAAIRQALASVKDTIDMDTLEQIITQAVASRLEEAIPLLDMEEGVRLAWGEMAPTAMAEAGEIAQRTLEIGFGLGERLEVYGHAAQAWVAEHGSELVTVVREETKAALQEKLNSILQQGFAEGRSARDLAREIEQIAGLDRQSAAFFDKQVAKWREEGLSESVIQRRADRLYREKLKLRGKRIATTEVGKAANQGQHEVHKQALQQNVVPSTTQREWMPRLGNVCPICESMRGQKVGINENFVARENGQQYFLPPAHVMCNCAIRLISPEV